MSTESSPESAKSRLIEVVDNAKLVANMKTNTTKLKQKLKGIKKAIVNDNSDSAAAEYLSFLKIATDAIFEAADLVAKAVKPIDERQEKESGFIIRAKTHLVMTKCTSLVTLVGAHSKSSAHDLNITGIVDDLYSMFKLLCKAIVSLADAIEKHAKDLDFTTEVGEKK